MTTLNEIANHREEILELARKYGVKDVRIFGSVARGEEIPESDIDLLINVEEDCDPFGFLKFQREVSSIMNRKVDIVFESGIYHLMKDSIMEEVRPL